MSQEAAVRVVYHAWIAGWNSQNADAMSAHLSEEAHVVGFDGTELKGRAVVRQAMADIFAHHPTGIYVTIVREVRFPSPSVALVRAVVGMVPRSGAAVNPAVNAVQTMVLLEQDGAWKIEAFQNTPAAFHGRMQDAMKLTQELQAAYDRGSH